MTNLAYLSRFCGQQLALIVFYFTFSSSLLAGGSEGDLELVRLLTLVNERLQLMEEVAAYKYVNGVAVQNTQREEIVINRALVSARENQLNPASVEAFFRLQIELAREVQEAWIKHWNLSGHEASIRSVVADLNTEIRPRLISLGDEIIRQIPRALPALNSTEQYTRHMAEIPRAINNPHVSLARKQKVLETLTMIRPEDQSEPNRLARVLARGTLRVGTTGDYKPFSFIGPTTGNLTGVDIDLAEDLADAMGVKLVLVKTSWPTLMRDFSADQFDIGMSGITHTQARQKSAFFSTPYLVGGKTPIARCEAKKKLDSLMKIDRAGVRVIVNPGGTNEKYVRSHIKNAQIILYPDNTTIFEQIINNHADVMITDAIEVEVQEAIHPELCGTMFEKRVDEKIDRRSDSVQSALLTHAVKAFLLPQDNYFKDYVDTWLGQIKQSGQLERTLARYTECQSL